VLRLPLPRHGDDIFEKCPDTTKKTPKKTGRRLGKEVDTGSQSRGISLSLHFPAS
jgi:hypothetical protein